MRTQTQTQSRPAISDRDREDAQAAIDFYIKARAKDYRTLEIILNIWHTKNWSDESKELFLKVIRHGLHCDQLQHSKTYTYTRQMIESWLRIRAKDQTRSEYKMSNHEK